MILCLAMSGKPEFDPDELYEATSLPEMTEWLERCELTLRTSETLIFSKWEQTFLTDIRRIFDDNVAHGRKRPLSGRSLQTLKKLWDKT